MENYITKATR